ncbi:RagB/SusD family nutrient uptake outer membrane protein [Sphingobacterium sp. LRF_L2]|uniref:RagB/SusD family nutrient uptake outer membrane protein n=1 Tax=Sphingobacterium sp. LRF_L2 TaxID=3369421 RepID=UPI003F6097C0
MKTTNIITIKIFALFIIILAGSCKKFLDVKPKGSKIPTTFADYDAFVKDESKHKTVIHQAVLLLNDRFEAATTLNVTPLNNANYFWNEDADRIALNNGSDQTYTENYAAISNWNLIIKYVPEATEATEIAKAELIAQAKVLRAMSYFVLANYYADTYETSNASTKLSVPYISSPDVNASFTQVTIAELYELMLKDVDEAIPLLNETSSTPLHPNLGTAYAFKARLYLQMSKYEEALDAANKALTYNDQLYDWRAYYTANKTRIEASGTYTQGVSPMGYSYIENYNMRFGSSTYSGRESSIRLDRASRFETGDAKFASRYKLRTASGETYYYSIGSGLYNHAGLTTTEVYLIKAECLARLNQITEALVTLDKVRITRIFAENYTPSTASTIVEAVKLIIKTKANELILGPIPFADRRRLNKDTNYATTYTKTENGNNYTLLPSSHLYTMPFPLSATQNPGNGTITQNVSK